MRKKSDFQITVEFAMSSLVSFLFSIAVLNIVVHLLVRMGGIGEVRVLAMSLACMFIAFVFAWRQCDSFWEFWSK